MIATNIETTSAASAAHCALSRTTPSRMKSVTRGRTAKIDVSPSEPDTGSSTCLYTAEPPSQVTTDTPKSLPIERISNRAAHVAKVTARMATAPSEPLPQRLAAIRGQLKLLADYL